MEVYIEKTNKSKTYNKGFKTALLLLKDLKISPDSVLIIKNNEVILLEEEVKKGDKIKLLSVVSGG